MDDALRLGAAFALAAAVTYGASFLAIRLAWATDFFDRPRDYKEHERATPYLGGLALMAGFLVSAIAFGSGLAEYWVLLVAALGLCALGTIDDRYLLGVAPRLAVTVLAALAIYEAGLGWSLFGGDSLLNLALTIFWVVGLVNAFNLMDNLDGATSTVAGVSAAGAGLIAVGYGDPALGALGLGLAGACLGFLQHNLFTGKATIFLGDGGSMPVGLIVATLIMVLPHPGFGWIGLLAAAPIAGLAIFDTTLVVVSRIRRGVGVLTGGRDHLTHRMLVRLGSPQRVAIGLAIVQSGLVIAAAVLYQLPEQTLLATGAVYIVLASFAIAWLETPRIAGYLEPERQPK